MASIAAATMERWFTERYRWSEPDVVAGIRQEFERCDPEGYSACCAAVRDADLRGDLEKITAPTLVIFGTQDPSTTGMDAGFIAAHLSEEHVADLDAAHLLNIEKASGFNKLLREFL